MEIDSLFSFPFTNIEWNKKELIDITAQNSIQFGFKSVDTNKYSLIKNILNFQINYNGIHYQKILTNESYFAGESIPCYSSIGPFLDTNSKSDGLEISFPPENDKNFFTNYNVSNKTLKWKAVNSFKDNQIMLTDLNNTPLGCAYMVVWYYSGVPIQAKLYIGSSGNMKIWDQKKLLYYYNGGRRHAEPDTDQINLTIEKGWNRLLVKNAKSTANWSIYLQIRDRDGNSIPELRYSAVPAE